MTSVCSETLLIAARALHGQCPYVTILNDSSAFLWKRLKSGATAAELAEAVCSEYEVDDPSSIHGFVEAFLQQMTEYHYVSKMDQGE